MNKSTQLIPAFASTLLARITLGIGFGAVALGITSVVVPQSALAQTGTVQPLDDFTTQQNERDPFTGDIGGGGFNVFNLMHQAQTRGTLDRDEFVSEQKQKLDRATEDFRRLQLQQIQRLNQQQTSPVTTPQPTN
jgi:hypothetical protein